jgi:NADH dehydrogenase
MRKSIFITGATGKIASFLIRSLIARNFQLTLLCRKNFPELPYHNHKIKILVADLLNQNSYLRGLEGTDIVLHFAAVTYTNNLKKYYKVNAEATFQLIQACKKLNVKKFVLISTRAISENGGEYCRSKLLAERYIQESGLDWVILRLAEVYGIQDNKGINFLLKNIHKFPFIPIIGSGKYEIAPIHIQDVVSVIQKVIEKENLENKIYNIAGPESFTYNQFIDKVLKLQRLKKVKIYFPVWFARILARFLAIFCEDCFIVVDQIPRLLSEKSDDITLAKEEFNFFPARLEDKIR